ncbi:MAG: N-carbamoylputrescine amidase [Peptococcaceae bacterium]|jgi:N-carbamoylputrescine amidase|nr:N-carbamoylputrescine amidase [Peptococcaceae bacterium]
MNSIIAAAVQMRCTLDRQSNLAQAEYWVREAAGRGAQIILLPELFETPYFCQKEKTEYYTYASALEDNPGVRRFRQVARELEVVLPVSFYEKKNQALYNSLAIIDADGTVLGKYRKSHIPDGPGYEEKFYFTPGDTGFCVWQTRYARIGAGICWDQWFPEAARAMVLSGAELLLYPTAIGSEPEDASLDSKDHWQICMQGQAAANLTPLVAANRVGTEQEDDSQITFYGSSFIAGAQGNILTQAGRADETVLTARFNLAQLEKQRREWGVFRDRRPDLYRTLITHDGEQ